MSALSGGVGLGAGVGRGRGVGTGPPFAVTAPMAKMRTANAALINFVIVFICFCFIFLLRNLPTEVLEFLPESENFFDRREITGGVQEARNLTSGHVPTSIKFMSPAELAARHELRCNNPPDGALPDAPTALARKQITQRFRIGHRRFAGEILA